MKYNTLLIVAASYVACTYAANNQRAITPPMVSNNYPR